MAELIPKGGKKWRVRLFCRRDDAGKKIYCYDKTLSFETIKKRNEHVRDLETRHAAGTLHEDAAQAAPLTLGGLVARWLAHKQPYLEPNTHTDYKRNLERYVTGRVVEEGRVEGGHLLEDGTRLGDLPLHLLRPAHIQGVYDSMAGRGLSARAIRNLHNPLRQALEMAVWWELIPTNPCARTKRPKVRRGRIEVLLPKEADPFIEAAKADRLGALFTFMLSNGPRPEECFGLKWPDVDFEAATATIRRVLKWNYEGGGWRLREYPKTEAGFRTLKLAPKVVQLLKEHRRRQLEERVKAGGRYRHNDLVFCTKTGEPLAETNVIRRHLRPLLTAAGLRRVTLYGLRHSFATLSIAAGEDAKYVSRQLGHESVAFTLDVYVHMVEELSLKAVGKLESVLFPKRKGKGK